MKLNNDGMDTRRLRLLLDLSRLGSMREVADEAGVTTSTVSQQIAVLAKEAGTALIEPDGRRVRLTPAGRRLAGHAVTILAAVDTARLDLDPDGEPAGVVCIAGFASAIRRGVVPVIAELKDSHPRVQIRIHEHEPPEALALLGSDEVDLVLTYDYNLAPAHFDRTVEPIALWSVPWSLAAPPSGVPGGSALDVFRQHRDRDWIVNSRHSADGDVVRTVASMAGFEPRVTHRVDGLELVQELIVAGLGVGLLPADRPTLPGVRLHPLTAPDVLLRAYAVVRRGHAAWPALALVLNSLRHATR